MANTKTYRIDPILGKIETVSSTPSINAESLTSQNTVNLPSYPTDTTNYQGIIGNSNSIIENNPVNNTSTQDEWFFKYLNSTPVPDNPVDTYNTVYNDSGVAEATTKVNDITAQLKAITDEATKTNLQLEGSTESGRATNTVARVLTGEEQNVNRQAAIKALPLQSQLLAAQGNLTAAQSKLDTAFEIQQQYQTQLYNYNKEIRDKVYEYASKQEQAKLDAQAKEDDRTFTLYRDNISNAQSIAKEAMVNGQSDIASQITALDPKSKTYTQDLANLQAQIVNPTAELDRKLNELQIQKAQQELVPTTPTGTISTVDTTSNDKTISTIDSLLTNKAISSTVGPNTLARFGYGSLTGANQNFASSVEQIVSQLSLNKLIEAKKQGATFGALSDREMDILAGAATKIAGWQIKDKTGKVIGYNIGENDFKKELKVIKEMAQKDKEAKLGISGTVLNRYLDSVDSIFNGSSNPYSIYIK